MKIIEQLYVLLLFLFSLLLVQTPPINERVVQYLVLQLRPQRLAIRPMDDLSGIYVENKGGKGVHLPALV